MFDRRCKFFIETCVREETGVPLVDVEQKRLYYIGFGVYNARLEYLYLLLRAVSLDELRMYTSQSEAARRRRGWRRLGGRAPASHVRVARGRGGRHGRGRGRQGQRRHRRGRRRFVVRLLDLTQVGRQVAARPGLAPAQERVALLCQIYISMFVNVHVPMRTTKSIQSKPRWEETLPSIVIRLAASGSRIMRARSCAVSESDAARGRYSSGCNRYEDAEGVTEIRERAPRKEKSANGRYPPSA